MHLLVLLGPQREGSRSASFHGNLLYYNCSLTIPAVTVFLLWQEERLKVETRILQTGHYKGLNEGGG